MEASHSTASKLLENLELITLSGLGRVLLGKKRERINEHPTLPHVPLDSKVALRVSYLAFLAHSSIRCGKLITKRDVFYMCRSLFPTPESVDRALFHLSSSLDVHRNELNIIAVPKGLVVGRVAYVDEFENAVDVGMFGNTGCLIPARPERLMNVVSDARAIIVVEKEAAFHSLIDESGDRGALSSFLVITGKGYPDIGTRLFLRTVAEAHNASHEPMPIYIITDADPHGLSIASCYIESLAGHKVQWLGVKHSDRGKMFKLEDSQVLQLNKKENSLLDGMLARWGKDADAKRPKQYLLQEAKNMKTAQTKFEMEALAANSGMLRGSHALLDYVLSKILSLSSSCK